MGDVRFRHSLDAILKAKDRAATLRRLSDDEVVQALAALSRATERDPYLANVLATEAMNRVHRSGVLARTAAAALVSVDRNGAVTDANPAALQVLRAKREAIVGSRYDAWVEALPETPTERALLAQEVRMRRADGESFDALVSTAPITRDGTVEGAVLLFIDITERKRLDEIAALERQRFYRILDNVTEGVVLVAPDGTYRYANPSAARMLGIQREREALSASTTLSGRVFDVEGRPLTVRDLPSHVATRTAHPVRAVIVQIETLEGDRIFVEIDAIPVLNEEGEVEEVVCSFDNVTDRLHTEQRSALLTSLVDNSEDAIILEAVDGTILEWNGAAARLLGYSQQEIVGRHISTLIPHGREDIQKINARVLRGEHVAPIETERVAKDGTSVPVLVTVSAVRDRAGRIAALSATYRDIRRIVEKRRLLAENEERYRSLFVNDPVAVFTFDDGGNIIEANRAALELVGYRREELLGKSFAPLLDPRELERAFENFTDVLSGHARTDQYTAIAKDGSVRKLRVTGLPVVVGGRIVGMHGRAEDVDALRAELDADPGRPEGRDAVAPSDMRSARSPPSR